MNDDDVGTINVEEAKECFELGMIEPLGILDLRGESAVVVVEFVAFLGLDEEVGVVDGFHFSLRGVDSVVDERNVSQNSFHVNLYFGTYIIREENRERNR